MFKGFYNLTSAMLTQGRRLDVISNNMTNVSTTGFKADRFTASTFDDVVWSLVGNKNKEYTEIGNMSFITAPSQLYTDYSQASFDETGLTLDFGIEGSGYFAIQTEDGIQYTRNGSFSLDDDGYLCLPGEGRVLDSSGNEMRIITDKVEADDYGGLFTEDGGFLGRIGVYVFEDDSVLEKAGSSLFISNTQGTAEIVKIHQGMVERSNVDLAQQMTEMIASERAYQSAAQITKIYDELMTKATTEIGRI